MKKRVLLSLLLAVLATAAQAHALAKCEANVNGYRISTVYVAGNHYNGVVWAYKHLSEETCLTPVTDPSKADAILEIVNNPMPDRGPSDYLSVSCSSGLSSTSCLDSDGNELTVDCDRRGNCSSYYGPSPGVALGHALSEWVHNASYQGEARLYTRDHKLIWKSENQKGHGPHEALWYDKLKLGTLAPPCQMPGAWGWSKYKNFRHWGTVSCGLDFDPLVVVDVKAEARHAIVAQKQSEADEMKRNAQEAAAKQ
jgi:hypothetical protein